jgi:hypothetical protein
VSINWWNQHKFICISAFLLGKQVSPGENPLCSDHGRNSRFSSRWRMVKLAMFGNLDLAVR